jgi:gluconolactonase
LTSRLVAVVAALVVFVATGLFITTRSDSDHRVIEASYPEGPLYDGSTLYYAEMGADVVTIVEDDEPRQFFKQIGCGPTAIAPYGDGYLVLCHRGRRVVALTANGDEVRTWAVDRLGGALLDPNDASADAHGGVYFSDPGVFSRNSRAEGRVMHLTAGGQLDVVADSLWYPNGVYVDQKRDRLLVSEHMAGRVLSFPIRHDGSLDAPATIARLADAKGSSRYATPYAETGPDGLEIGPNGDVFVAVYGEGRVVRFGLDGVYRGEVELPTRYVTNITFAPDGTAVTTGSFTNVQPPFPGEVRFHAANALESDGV